MTITVMTIARWLEETMVHEGILIYGLFSLQNYAKVLEDYMGDILNIIREDSV